MKKIVLAMVLGIFMMVGTVGTVGTVNAATVVPLKATWTANVESDVKEYKLYRTDGVRILLGTITHPTITFLFTISIPDNVSGTATFALTALDTSNNESGDATASYSYTGIDTIAPAKPSGFVLTKQ